MIDVNCDLGEGAGNDETLMPLITSASIACGGHCGDEQSMLIAIRLAQRFGVKIGAHPSYVDRADFGRRELPVPAKQLQQQVADQLAAIRHLCAGAGAAMLHVKPHGALYNAAARNDEIAAAVVRAVIDVDARLRLFAPPGSRLHEHAASVGLVVWAEAFADRTYQPDGSLTPRSEHNALIIDPWQALDQAREIAERQRVIAVDGSIIPLQAQTLCIHGDGTSAVAIARALHEYFRCHTQKP